MHHLGIPLSGCRSSRGPRPSGRRGAALAAGLLVVASRSWAAEPYAAEVVLNDGRSVAGFLDERTTAQNLWLRREEEGLVLIAPLPWSAIARVVHAGRPVDRAVLQREFAARATPAPRGVLAVGPAWRPAPSLRPIEPAAAEEEARIVSIETVGVRPLYADRYAGPDGFELLLAVHASGGGPLEFRGTLEAEVYGERCSLTVGRGGWETLARPRQAVCAADLVDGTLALPVRLRRPWERTREGALMPAGRARIRLLALGHGAFEAEATVPFRPFDPVLDWLELEGYRRFPLGNPASYTTGRSPLSSGKG